MQKTDFHDAVEEVLKSNSDYSADSYYFLQEVPLQAVEKQRKMSGGENKHVSGLELLDAFRERMLKQFGTLVLRKCSRLKASASTVSRPFGHKESIKTQFAKPRPHAFFEQLS